MNAVVKDKADVYGDFNTYESKLVAASNKVMTSLDDSSQY